MTTEIIPLRFEGSQVRTLIIDGNPWWVLGDVANALGIINPRDILSRLDDDEKGVAKIDTLGGRQNAAIVNEPGLYSVILRSDKPEAKRFKRWLTHEVLPTIRKTGTYTAPAAAVERLPMDIIREQHGAIGILLEHNERMAVEVATLTPSAEAWNELVSAKGDYDVAEAAKILAHAGISTGPQRLFDFMREIRWTFRAPHGKWEPYSDAVDAGYLAMKPQSHFHPGTGEKVIDPPQVRVTLKGVERLRVRMTSILKAVNA